MIAAQKASAASVIVRHAASAKQLLAALAAHAERTTQLIGGDTSIEFFAALEERDQLLGALNGVIQAIMREPVKTVADQQTRVSVVQEIVAAATAALASHQELVGRIKQERDRLADAVERSNKPDPVAKQYFNYGGARSAGFSVAG